MLIFSHLYKQQNLIFEHGKCLLSTGTEGRLFQVLLSISNYQKKYMLKTSLEWEFTDIMSEAQKKEWNDWFSIP